MASKSGTSGGVGDKYIGLDRFGRTVGQRWSTCTGTDIDRYQYAYDDANNPTIRANLLNGRPVAIYAYDALGRRVSEFLNASSPAETRHCYYSDQWQVIEERVQTTARSTTGRLNAQYVWSPVSVDAMSERDRDSNGDAILDERVYALQDANWNVTALVAGPGVAGYAVGAIINRFASTPYGTTQLMTPSWTAASSTAIPWKHTFQGLAGNTFTGLYDARNRDYSPTLGRFIEPDPIGFQAGDSNFYRFVGNGPVGRNDPMGLDWGAGWIQDGLSEFGGWGIAAARSLSPINFEIHADIHTQGANARQGAWEGYENSTNSIDAGANLIFGVGLGYVGEGFAHTGMAFAEAVPLAGIASATKNACRPVGDFAVDLATRTKRIGAAPKGIPRGGTARPGVLEVPLDELVPTHPVPRPGHSVEAVAKLISENGYRLEDAIPVLKMPNGKQILAGGNHRLAAMRLLGEKSIPARVVDWAGLPDRTKQWYRTNFPDVFEGH